MPACAESKIASLLSILVYGYATGVFSSRKLENVTYDSIAFRFVAADEHPDHDTLNSFRKRFLKDIEVLMVQVLMIARTLGGDHWGPRFPFKKIIPSFRAYSPPTFSLSQVFILQAAGTPGCGAQSYQPDCALSSAYRTRFVD